MAKLHEVLAVEGDLEGLYKRIVSETSAIFEKKGEHFTGLHKTLRMFDEQRQREAEAAEEHREMVTTVPDKLVYAANAIARYLDCVLQKEATNQEAKADLVVDGKILAINIPATFLLGLEKRLVFIRGMYEHIPTLAPGIEWKVDDTKSEGVYVAIHPEKTNKTAKLVKHQVLVQPTKEHPAQIEKWTEDTPVGLFTTRKWSGMMSSRDKHERLARIDTLIRAVKEARQRANCQEVIKAEIGEKLFGFIEAGLL